MNSLPLLTTEEMLIRLAEGALDTAPHSQVRQMLLDVGGAPTTDDPQQAIQTAAAALERLHLSAEGWEGTAAEAAEESHASGPAATPLGVDRWLVIVGKRGSKLRVATPGSETQDVTPPSDFTAPRRWVFARNLQQPSATDGHALAAAHSAGSHHDAHGHHDHDHAHMSPLQRLFVLLKPESTDVMTVAIFSSVVSILSLATPLAVEALVNTIAFGRLVQPLVVLGIILFGFLAFAAILRGLQAWVAELIQRRIFVRVVADLSWRLPRIDQTALDRQNGPELINRFFDVMTVQKSAALLVIDGIALVVQILVGMAVLAFYHPILLGLDAVLLATMGVCTLLLGRGAVTTAIDESKAKYAVAAWLEDLARHTLAFKSAGGPEHGALLADELTGKYLRAREDHFAVLFRQVCFALGLQAVLGSLLFGVGGWLVLNGQLNLGQLVAAELIVTVIVGSFAKMGKHIEGFYDLLAAVDKLGHLFDLPVERQQGQRSEASPAPLGATLTNVSYHYEDGRHSVHPLSLDIPAGKLCCITGSSGAGKSTLLDLLFALRTPTTGSVLLGAQDLRELRPAEVRESVALVRGLDILNSTIAHNLTLQRTHVPLDAATGALADLGLLAEVRSFPDGMETPLSFDGSPLSESQTRLLILARALAGKPRLLLIDGLLDALPDARLPLVLECLKSKRQQMTIVVVTGREDVIRHCDHETRLQSADQEHPLAMAT